MLQLTMLPQLTKLLPKKWHLLKMPWLLKKKSLLRLTKQLLKLRLRTKLLLLLKKLLPSKHFVFETFCWQDKKAQARNRVTFFPKSGTNLSPTGWKS